MNSNQNNFILYLSIPLSILVIITSLGGMLIPNIYVKESLNWQAQSVGQDMIDIFLAVPVLIVTSILAFRKNKIGLMLWSGTVMYLLYIFIIYCFAVPFNNLFIVYCFALGLSFYSFMYWLFSQFREPVENWFSEKLPRKTIGITFIVISVLFYFTWLSDILPAQIYNITPKSLVESGLITNPVHIMDLSVFLPGLIIIAIFLFKRKRLGVLMVPAILTFFILMNITIGTLIVIMKMKGVEAELSLTILFGFLTLYSIVLLIMYFRSMKKP